MDIFSAPDFPESRPPSRFGQHPAFEKSFQKWQRGVIDGLEKGKFCKCNTVRLASIPKVGRVSLIPRDRYIEIVDGCGDRVAVGSLDSAMLPFSSYDFFADIYEDEYFCELLEQPFFRLGKISQLGYLVPPKPENWKLDATIVYPAPYFSHTRWAHSRLVAFLMEIILARHGYTEKERLPVVLTGAYHDCAMPAGGDSVKRVDSEALNEEENFEWVLRHYGLVQKWSREYGFDIERAKQWVKGIGLFGRLLDIIDRMAYTALDCYYVGYSRPCKLRSLGLEIPLVMDVWQDLKINNDRSDLAFADLDRLFKFLLFRAYEHEELLMNPYSRALDFFLQELVQPLYQRGIITRAQLLLNDDDWLRAVLKERYPNKNVWAFLEPESLNWKKFDKLEELQRFCSGDKTIDHVEHIKGFDTGLGLGVYSGGKIVPIRELLTGEKINALEEINRQIKGYYAYHIKE